MTAAAVPPTSSALALPSRFWADLTTRDFASFDEAASRWIAEAGEYTLRAGTSSRNLPLTATFTIAGEIDGGAVTKALAPQLPINRLTRK